MTKKAEEKITPTPSAEEEKAAARPVGADSSAGNAGPPRQPQAHGGEPELSKDEEIEILREINEQIGGELAFYKSQAEAINEKLRTAVETKILLASTEEKLKETQKDYDNLKQRAAAQVEAAQEEGLIKAVKEILPVVDNFRRALSAIKDPKSNEGLLLIYRQILETLSRLGVEEIPALGLPFDPEVHHAVMQAAVKDPTQAGLVIEVFQKGYSKGKKVIRHSQVKVAK